MDQMGQLLEEAGMRGVLPLPKARVPVVKFVVPDTNTKVRLPAVASASGLGGGGCGV